MTVEFVGIGGIELTLLLQSSSCPLVVLVAPKWHPESDKWQRAVKNDCESNGLRKCYLLESPERDECACARLIDEIGVRFLPCCLYIYNLIEVPKIFERLDQLSLTSEDNAMAVEGSATSQLSRTSGTGDENEATHAGISEALLEFLSTKDEQV